MPARSVITLAGAGRMGTALLRGWLAGKARPDIRVLEPEPSAEVEGWAEAGRIRLNPEPDASGLLVIALKPQQFAGAAPALLPFAGPGACILSIMAGVRLSQLSQRFSTPRVLRAMPNTPGSIGQGISVLSAPPGASAADIALARKALAPLGDVEGPVDEALMPAVTALSGSGPAYLFLLAESMAEAGTAEGLPVDLAGRLARRTVEGAVALLAASGESPESLRRAVTSPGGTTAAALDILMNEGGIPELLRKAIRAAAARERELSREAD